MFVADWRVAVVFAAVITPPAVVARLAPWLGPFLAESWSHADLGNRIVASLAVSMLASIPVAFAWEARTDSRRNAFLATHRVYMGDDRVMKVQYADGRIMDLRTPARPAKTRRTAPVAPVAGQQPATAESDPFAQELTATERHTVASLGKAAPEAPSAPVVPVAEAPAATPFWWVA
jgi:hypothetical protein